ncbi:hypothetical protein [Methylomarinum vadi]|uniref:hypothetical protein n=1 Tax=Methylomarinum vadi TaxID=438855 RepID=UPI0004DF4C5D|nr:hypothetical protein [Methylomarinum vadi]
MSSVFIYLICKGKSKIWHSIVNNSGFTHTKAPVNTLFQYPDFTLCKLLILQAGFSLKINNLLFLAIYCTSEELNLYMRLSAPEIHPCLSGEEIAVSGGSGESVGFVWLVYWLES